MAENERGAVWKVSGRLRILSAVTAAIWRRTATFLLVVLCLLGALPSVLMVLSMLGLLGAAPSVEPAVRPNSANETHDGNWSCGKDMGDKTWSG